MIQNPRLDSRAFSRSNEILRVGMTKKWVALTFDDGPDPHSTPSILDILGRFQARATFFIIGQAALRHRSLLRQVIQRGHEVGNHSFSHRKLQLLSHDEVKREIRHTDAILRKAGFAGPILFRAPYGRRGFTKLRRALGARRVHVLFDIEPHPPDYLSRNPGELSHYVVSHVRPGSIVVLHDGVLSGLPNRNVTVSALKHILFYLQAIGYKFVTVSELLAEGRKEGLG